MKTTRRTAATALVCVAASYVATPLLRPAFAAPAPASTSAASTSAAPVDETGSAEAAKTMLERAVVALKASQAKALADFSAGRSGFRERDLYVFCARVDGRVDAHIDPKQLGRNIKDLYDVDGVAFGQELMAIAQENTIKAVSYMWPKPGSATPAEKVSFITKVGDQVCGVGYYK